MPFCTICGKETDTLDFQSRCADCITIDVERNEHHKQDNQTVDTYHDDSLSKTQLVKNYITWEANPAILSAIILCFITSMISNSYTYESTPFLLSLPVIVLFIITLALNRPSKAKAIFFRIASLCFSLYFSILFVILVFAYNYEIYLSKHFSKIVVSKTPIFVIAILQALFAALCISLYKVKNTNPQLPKQSESWSNARSIRIMWISVSVLSFLTISYLLFDFVNEAIGNIIVPPYEAIRKFINFWF